VNGGRVAEVATGYRFSGVQPAASLDLPPPGPYPSGCDAAAVIQALHQAKDALTRAEAFISRGS
jgi:hypothetical protein